MEHINGSSSVAATTTTTTSSSTSVSASSTAVVLHAEPAAATAATAATAAMKQQQQQPPRRRSLVPQGWEDQVRALGIAEHKEAGLSLAQAFARDDLAQWLVDAEGGGDNGDEARWRLHVDIFTYLVAQHCYAGAVTSIGPDYEAVALWVLPGQDTDEWTTELRSGLWRLRWRLSAEGRRRYWEELMPLLHDVKREVLGPRRDRDSYYLVYLGTKPSGRGRGYARLLIEQMAVRADAEGRAMYLESSSVKNNAYYKKFGFEAKRDIHLGLSVDDNNNNSVGGDANSRSSTSLSSSSSSSSSDSESGPKPAVTLTVMVREPRRKLANSIPIKLSGGFVGGGGGGKQQ